MQDAAPTAVQDATHTVVKKAMPQWWTAFENWLDRQADLDAPHG